METISLDVRLRCGAGTVRGHLRATETDSDEYQVEVIFEGRRILGAGGDYFEALLQVRQRLEADGMLVGLVGAERDVWPSPMARSMGGGLRAYRMTLGQQARTADLVDIFASSDAPARVSEQEAFRTAWIESLGGASRGTAI